MHESNSKQANGTLSIVSAMYAHRNTDGIYIHLSFGRIVDQLAKKYAKIYLCVPVLDLAPSGSRDYLISAPNIEVIPQPPYTSTAGAFRKPFGILASYSKLCRLSGTLFIRGMVPFVGFLYLFCLFHGVRTCHWLVGNPEALLKSHSRGNRIKVLLAKTVARFDRIFTKIGRRFCRGAFLCNGQELGDLYSSKNTKVVVSSTVLRDEVFFRENACSGDCITLLYVGFLRPEKGVEYLLKALPGLSLQKEWRLVVVGDFDKFSDYKIKITKIIEELGISDKIEWLGYIPYGENMFKVLRSSDIMILPTLSEGTPRVLVEARASGLPVIASNVGGIPSSIANEHDGLLVPPKFPAAISEAIGRVVEDPVLRKSLIVNGYDTVSRFTVESFVEQTSQLCSSLGANDE